MKYSSRQGNGQRDRRWWLGAVLFVVFVAWTTSGCTTLARPEELGYQAMNIADMALTARNVRDPCIEEGNPVTRTLVGRNPSAGSLAVFGLASGAAHLGISNMLLENGWSKTYKVWQAVTITNAGLGVGWNVDIKSRRCGR